MMWTVAVVIGLLKAISGVIEEMTESHLEQKGRATIYNLKTGGKSQG